MQALAALFVEVVAEAVFLFVVVGKAVAGADPDAALAVDGDDAGDVVGYGGGVGGIVLVDGEGVAVVFVDAVVGGKPHVAALVLVDGEDGALGKTVAESDVDKGDLLGLCCKA